MEMFQIDTGLFEVTGMKLLLLKNISYDAGGKRVIYGLDLATNRCQAIFYLKVCLSITVT